MDRRHRVFFALWPDEPALVALDALANDAQHCGGGRRTSRENLHLTLAFIGDVDCPGLQRLVDVGNALTAPVPAVMLDTVAGWRHNQIIYVGCSAVPSCLLRLVETLHAKLATADFEIDRRPWTPHVTLVRNARWDRLPTLESAVILPGGELTLVQSRREASGAQYEILQRWTPEG